MAADNHTTIVGNLVDDPELRFTNTGIPVANMRVAVTQRIQQDGEWRDGDTSFLRVNVWRGQAEHLADSLAKGDRVMVTGRLRQRSWETPEGEKAVGHRGRGRRGRRLAEVGHRQGRTRPQPWQRASAAPVGSGRPNGAATSTTARHSEHRSTLSAPPAQPRGCWLPGHLWESRGHEPLSAAYAFRVGVSRISIQIRDRYC
jgi:single stranded DNA-binding protein